MGTGIQSHRLVDTPVAVIDFETTGLTPGYDRVVEVSVVRIDPGKEPRLVFDTLINPNRPMAATEIHGISDGDVAKAPKFQDIAGELLAAIKGCVLAAYNVYFDMKFLNFELSNSGVNHEPPHFCLMYLRPMLGIGSRCKLAEACTIAGVPYDACHISSNDAIASARLFRILLNEIVNRNISTYGDLAKLKTYKFANSFSRDPFPEPEAFGLKRFDGVVSRAGFEQQIDPVRRGTAEYWEALKTVLADLEISEEEVAYIKAEQRRSGLKAEQLRVLHVRAFASVMAQFASDQWIDDREVRKLRKLHQCLAQLGWAPGQ